MSVCPVDYDKPSDAPPFSEEINEGAMLAVIVVAGIVVCSIVNKGEMQSATKNPLPQTFSSSATAANL